MLPNYAEQYVDLWRRHWWWRSRQAFVNAQVRRLLEEHCGGERPQLLDIGCGGGVAFDQLSQFAEVYGLEPDQQLIDRSPGWRERVERVAFDAEYESPRSYDLVLMLDVLEHIEDDRGATENLARLLSRGGHVLLTVPALPALWSVHDEVNLHFRRYTKAGLTTRLEEAGFRVKKMQYFFGWSLGLVYLRRLLTSRKQQDEYHVSVPPQPINRLFELLSRTENACSRWLAPPLGSSLLAIAALDD